MERHRAQKPVGSGRYASGQKRCKVCEIFIKWDSFWCPCCGYKLRTQPRNSIFKKRFGIVSIRKPVSNEYFVEKVKALLH